MDVQYKYIWNEFILGGSKALLLGLLSTTKCSTPPSWPSCSFSLYEKRMYLVSFFVREDKQEKMTFSLHQHILKDMLDDCEVVPFPKWRTKMKVTIYSQIIQRLQAVLRTTTQKINPLWLQYQKEKDKKELEFACFPHIKNLCVNDYLNLYPQLSARDYLQTLERLIQTFKQQAMEEDRFTHFEPDFLLESICQDQRLTFAEKIQKVQKELLPLFPQHDRSIHLCADYALNQEQDPEKAIALFKSISNSQRIQEDVFFGLGCAFYKMMQLDEARKMYQTLLHLNPWVCQAWNNLGIVFRDQGENEKAIEYFEKCCHTFLGQFHHHLPLDHYFVACHNKYLSSNNQNMYRKEDAPFKNTTQRVSQFHLTWNLILQSASSYFPKPLQKMKMKMDVASADSKKKKTIGLVSGDFFYHSVSFFIEPFLEFFDKEILRVVCFSNVPPSQMDAKTNQLKQHVGGHAQWIDIYQMNHVQVFEAIQKEKVDILVDLSGHTSHTRLPVFYLRPAPIQVSWIGYPNTTGLAEMDYRICDPITDTQNREDQIQTFSESLVYRPDQKCFLCYKLQDWQLSPSSSSSSFPAPPFIKNQYITFGSFNHTSKITQSVVFFWSQILKKLPSSKMMFKSKLFLTERGQEEWRRKFKVHGIEADRLILIPFSRTGKEHIQFYHDMDISLDTFPYSGTTTTCESMAMGVPVITFYQPKHTIHSQNVSASLIKHVDAKKWDGKSLFEYCVASSVEEYIEKALALALSPHLLSRFKQELRQVMSQSSLCDQKEYCRQMTQLFLSLS